MSKGNYWHVLPRDVAEWRRRRNALDIKFGKNEKPYIKGPATKDGVITGIKLVNGKVVFEVES
jgi:hypothetical protein